MAARCPVYDMGGLDRDAPRLLLRRRVYRVIGLEITEILGDCRRQRRLPMVHMPNRPDIDMRLRPLELLLRHFSVSSLFSGTMGPTLVRSGVFRLDFLADIRRHRLVMRELHGELGTA